MTTELTATQQIQAILDMRAGRDLDLLVAEHVMGWRDFRVFPSGYSGLATTPEGITREFGPVWSATWGNVQEILDRLRAEGWDVVIESREHDYRVGVDWRETQYREEYRYWSEAKDGPLAVCRAAVAALVSERLARDTEHVLEVVDFWDKRPWQTE